MASKGGAVRVDIKKMQRLYESLKTKPHILVGVFQSDSARKDGGLTNAELASYHENGAPEHGLPKRSFLREPIADHVDTIMAPFKGQAVMDALVTGGAMKLWRSIGVAAEKVVQQAFATGGFGKWPSLKGSTLLAKLKGSLKKRKDKIGRIYAGQLGEGILIRTGQLRRAVSSRVRMGFS